jgi:threonine aldolase
MSLKIIKVMNTLAAIELRSDTFTKPTPNMLTAMMNAAVGDDVFGEDPSINALEQMAANMFGMEAALFCPSGTMTNQNAINVHTQPGDEVICEEGSHIFYYEGGGIGKNSGCQARLIKGNRGQITAAQIAEVINPDDVHRARTRLVSLENTCNRGGGSCYNLNEIAEIRNLCNAHGLSLHLDGARLMNAIVAQNEDPLTYGKLFHSISLCLSKGLGAPVGSVLLGSKEFIKEARRVRKVMGGGMRQAGFLAAAASYALENQVERLSIDHAHAKKLGMVLSELNWVDSVLPVETNIVIFAIKMPATVKQVSDYLLQYNIRVSAMSSTQIRMVTHLDVSPEMIDFVIEKLYSFSI